ncbi:hypothetical protein JRQ81_012222 [Phrynocephalus forsythii]|uniref:Uncharacterized protein n=1 Tax=Phrynocephalus forsythii TaxID=171643 RepID=A0A9Q1AQC2_9SAUR|nr:hypothetical protein JRQ81_012222 [Phrynocephalus forsythii]
MLELETSLTDVSSPVMSGSASTKSPELASRLPPVQLTNVKLKEPRDLRVHGTGVPVGAVPPLWRPAHPTHPALQTRLYGDLREVSGSVRPEEGSERRAFA